MVAQRGGAPGKIMKGHKKMKKNSKSDELTFNVTIEGLTIHDIIEILALRGEELPEEVLRKIS